MEITEWQTFTATESQKPQTKVIHIDNIRPKNILVIGDIMLDTYFYGEVNRISPEAPVPVFRKLRERSVLGGSANVAANLSAAHQNVSVMSILGNDKAGERLRRLFKEQDKCIKIYGVLL